MDCKIDSVSVTKTWIEKNYKAVLKSVKTIEKQVIVIPWYYRYGFYGFITLMAILIIYLAYRYVKRKLTIIK